jgi:hypothetical protein
LAPKYRFVPAEPVEREVRQIGEAQKTARQLGNALQRALEAAGVEFTNGDQPGVRLTAATQSTESASGSNPTVATKAGRPKTTKETEKKK